MNRPLRLFVSVLVAAAALLSMPRCLMAGTRADPKEVWTPVIITFTGICTLYDEKGWQGIETSLTMLLVNSDAPFAAVGHGGIERHVPFLVFGEQYLPRDGRHGSRLFAMTNPQKGNQPSWRYEPRGEELFLDPDAVIDPATLEYTLDGDSDDPDKRWQCPTLQYNPDSLHWIPRMTYALAEEIHERDSFLEAPRPDPRGAAHPDPERVHARFLINAGKLRAGVFMSENHDQTVAKTEVILWDFKQREDDESRHSQAMAQEIVWSFRVKGDRLTLYRRPFDAPLRETKVLTFQPDKEGFIQIRIGHTRPADILPDRRDGHLMERDHHFALYYKSVFNIDVPAVVPFAGNYCPPESGGFGSVDGLNCGPNRLP